uniref:Uncharacterized protein n=1 Tax=Fagus sylvatica TaxID=28930 RepID=A0A2N9GY52_FAGSY
MAGARREMINGGNISRTLSGRPIPRRGQVKVAIVLGLVHSFSSMFSPNSRANPAGAAHVS